MRVFVYAFHKTASMFLYRYFKELAHLSGAHYFSISNEPSNQNDWQTATGDFIVCPIRFKDAALLSLDSSAKNIIHLRDPIDVLISQYFSFGWTHTPKNTQEFVEKRSNITRKTVDEYCLEEVSMVGEKYRTFMRMYDTIPNKIVSDYSGMRTNFKKWNAHMCRNVLDHHNQAIENKMLETFGHEFGLLHKLSEWLGWYTDPKNIFSGKVNPHRRDGSDNQKNRYLQPETIAKLEYELRDVLDFFHQFQKTYDQET